jgi:excisionase family DNA binding protein
LDAASDPIKELIGAPEPHPTARPDRQSRRFRGLLTFSRIFSHFLYDYQTRLVAGTMADEILTIRGVAELLKINEKTAYKLASAGQIPGFKVGGSWRFDRQEIARWIRRKIDEQQASKGEE